MEEFNSCIQFRTFYLGFQGLQEPLQPLSSWITPALTIGEGLGLPKESTELERKTEGNDWVKPDGEVCPILSTASTSISLDPGTVGKMILEDRRSKLQELLDHPRPYLELLVSDALSLLGAMASEWEDPGMFNLNSTDEVGTLLAGIPGLVARRLGEGQLRSIQQCATLKATKRHEAALHRQNLFGQGKPEDRDEDPALKICLEKIQTQSSSIRSVGAKSSMNYESTASN